MAQLPRKNAYGSRRNQHGIDLGFGGIDRHYVTRPTRARPFNNSIQKIDNHCATVTTASALLLYYRLQPAICRCDIS
jgi:hypothetical protein